MNFGAFAVVILLENRLGSSHIDACRGIGRRAPFLAACLTVFLFSLIGVPPTSGFFGKFHLLMGVMNIPEWPYYTLAAAAIVNTAISAYYYLRIAKAMYFEPTDVEEALETPALGRVVVLGMVVLTFYLFFMATELLNTTLNLELHL
jgi:NADH-quinone oxidoreductase subunit N